MALALSWIPDLTMVIVQQCHDPTPEPVPAAMSDGSGQDSQLGLKKGLRKV